MAVEREVHPEPAMRPPSRTPQWTGFLFLAWKQLRNRWLESALVLLGLALGVAVLTTALSYMAFALNAQQRLEALPDYRAMTLMPQQADFFRLFEPGAPPALPLRRLEGDPPQITLDLAFRIRGEIDGVEYVLLGGGRQWRSSPVQAVDDEPVAGPPGEEIVLNLSPASPDFFAAHGYQVIAGQSFTWEDMEARRPVLVVQESWAERFLPDVPLEQVPGHRVTALGTTWSIVAVVRRPEGPFSGASPFGPSEFTYGPWGAPDAPADEAIDELQVLPRADANRSAVRRELELLLTEVFGPDQMTVSSPQDLIPEEQRQVTLAIAGLASLALLVASLNVLNLFLTRVVRRRRHLALSTALGASRRTVFGQTLLESLVLGLGGGATGIALALAGVRLIENLVLGGVPEGFFEEGMQLGVGPALAGLAAALAASILFGLYPALAASSQDPAQALRE